MPGHKISYINQEEPSFIKQFKQRTGFKDSVNIEAKVTVTKYKSTAMTSSWQLGHHKLSPI